MLLRGWSAPERARRRSDTMRWRQFHLVACGVVLGVGCGQLPPTGSNSEDVLGPGRFAHSAIQKTIAPWDGPATQLYLAEKPLDEGNLTGPLVSVRVYR